ncbi:hypothetical protein [Haloarchaeobius litoreus]|uniref:Uncharacterized protein n=1 Tax=Haloarchaeobius litoreus TaxID=755306 RepID=A0ABD6DFY6_9EURY|nr:hypothetical protein [Haloarchaeobius litoreus]
MTDNHSYNTPTRGATDWHIPLNDNFERLDGDVEVRDRESNRGDYAAKAGAKFFATDTGATFIGDGSNWNRLATTGETPTYQNVSVTDPPAANTDVARKAELDAKADTAHTHSGDDISPETVTADRIEATTVVASDAGTTVWGAYQHPVPSGTTTTVEFESVETDQRSQWDDANHRIEVTEPGNYLVSAGVSWYDAPSEGTNHWFTVRQNGNLGVLQDFDRGTEDSTLQATRPVLGVQVGDTFHLEAEHYEGSELRIGGSRVSTYLSVVQL